MSIKQLAMRLVYGHKASSGTIRIMAPKPGDARWGNMCIYTRHGLSEIDTQRPWMIEIGDNVQIRTGQGTRRYHDSLSWRQFVSGYRWEGWRWSS